MRELQLHQTKIPEEKILALGLSKPEIAQVDATAGPEGSIVLP
jgi:hypothetical protein